MVTLGIILIQETITPYILPSGTTVTFNVGDGSSHRGLVSIKEYKIVVQ